MSDADGREMARANADRMVAMLWEQASMAIASERLTRQDRFGFEADMRLRLLHERLVRLGWIVETSTSGSVYYSRDGQRLRLSNHEVPWTSEREHAVECGGWSWHRCGWQIVTATSGMDVCLREIEEMEEAIAE